MKDAYSFDTDEAGLDKNYQAMYEAYQRIFSRLGLKTLITEADSGIMGGKVSHEFMVPAENGEDLVLRCPKCNKAITAKDTEKNNCALCAATMDKINCIEVGHIFKLGTKYTSTLNASFLDAKGKLQPIIMGCYGIGVSRLISAVIEQNNDSEGIIWPMEAAPYQVIILPLDVSDKQIMSGSMDIYKKLRENGVDVLLDDRDTRPGVKFKDADLLGIPLQVIIGKEFLQQQNLELKVRRDAKNIKSTPEQVYNEIIRIING
jgi:prolyl-tRNA synthetase